MRTINERLQVGLKSWSEREGRVKAEAGRLSSTTQSSRSSANQHTFPPTAQHTQASPTSGRPGWRWAARAACRRWTAGIAAAGGVGTQRRRQSGRRRAPVASCSPIDAPQAGAPGPGCRPGPSALERSRARRRWQCRCRCRCCWYRGWLGPARCQTHWPSSQALRCLAPRLLLHLMSRCCWSVLLLRLLRRPQSQRLLPRQQARAGAGSEGCGQRSP